MTQHLYNLSQVAFLSACGWTVQADLLQSLIDCCITAKFLGPLWNVIGGGLPTRPSYIKIVIAIQCPVSLQRLIIWLTPLKHIGPLIRPQTPGSIAEVDKCKAMPEARRGWKAISNVWPPIRKSSTNLMGLSALPQGGQWHTSRLSGLATCACPEWAVKQRTVWCWAKTCCASPLLFNKFNV